MKAPLKKLLADKPLLKKLGMALGIAAGVAVIAGGVYLLWFRSPGPVVPEVTTEAPTTEATTSKEQAALVERFVEEMISYGKAKGLNYYDTSEFYDWLRNPDGAHRERSSIQFPYAVEKIPEDGDWDQAIESVFQGCVDYITRSLNKPLPYFSVTYTNTDVMLHRDWVSAKEE